MRPVRKVTCGRHRDKLGYFASLPLPYLNETLKEIDFALDHDALGFTVPTNTGSLFRHADFDPIYARLNQRRRCPHARTGHRKVR